MTADTAILRRILLARASTGAYPAIGAHAATPFAVRLPAKTSAARFVAWDNSGDIYQPQT